MVATFFSSLDDACADSPTLNYVFYFAFTLGLVTIVVKGLSFLTMLLDLFVVPQTDFAKYGSKKKAWAVVTGATDGLGKEFANQLALKGFNLVLVSRNPETLATVAQEIADKHEVKTDVFALDFSDPSPQFVQRCAAFQKFLNDKKYVVTVLINNVGKSHSIPVPFELTTDAELSDIVTINTLSTLRFTQAVIPYLKECVKVAKVKGLILNIGSFSGLLPTPMLATYSGSKAFVQNWSAALASELSADKIDVHAVLAYLITSKMSKIRKSSAMIPTPKEFVRATLGNFQNRGGAQERFMTTTPFWSHALMHWFIENSVGVYSKTANLVNLQMHEGIRKRALRKAAKKKSE